jgi:hypothetical protein
VDNQEQQQAAAPSPPTHAFFLCDAKKTTTHQDDGDPEKGRATATVPYFRAAASTTDPGNRKTEHRVKNPKIYLFLLAYLLPLPLTWEFIYLLIVTMMRIFSFSQLFYDFQPSQK